MPKNLLQQYFPMIRTRSEILQIIRNNPKLNNIFMSWQPEQRFAKCIKIFMIYAEI